MPCSHIYHVACVEKLRSYDIKQVCPTCRVDLPPGPEQVFEVAVRRWWVLHCRYGQGDDKPWRRIRNGDDRRENAEVVRMVTEGETRDMHWRSIVSGSCTVMAWACLRVMPWR